jgi:hypothetical protein
MNRLIGQSKVKGGASIYFAFGPYFPPVFGNNAMHKGQAHTSTFKVGWLMKALKHSK